MTGGTLDHLTPRQRRRHARRAARRYDRQMTAGRRNSAPIRIAAAPPSPAAEQSCLHDRRGRSATYMVIHPSGTATVCADCHAVLSTDTHPTILTPRPRPARPRRPPEPPG